MASPALHAEQCPPAPVSQPSGQNTREFSTSIGHCARPTHVVLYERAMEHDDHGMMCAVPRRGGKVSTRTVFTIAKLERWALCSCIHHLSFKQGSYLMIT
jgi:hypothetical protein